MTKLSMFAGIAALTLLAGCGGQDQPPNVITTVETGNSDIVMPEANIAEPGNAADNGAEAAAAALNLAPDELTVVLPSGSARHVSFGMGKDVAVPIVTAALGKPGEAGRNNECAQGPMDMVDFEGGLTLFFQADKFVGWDLDGRDNPTFTTASGIGIGSTLRELRDAMTVTIDEDSSLGHEFASGGMGGLLSSTAPDGKITHIWAGSTCQFR